MPERVAEFTLQVKVGFPQLREPYILLSHAVVGIEVGAYIWRGLAWISNCGMLFCLLCLPNPYPTVKDTTMMFFNPSH